MTTVGPSRTQADFGALLWLWRNDRRLSQAAFGALLVPKVLPSTVSHWERGIRYPARRYVWQIVSITGLPTHVVLGAPADLSPGDQTVSPEAHP
jgi:transcriptional regulator with XRE-family HTH domain